MTSLTSHLSKYAAYHRDRRNIATHFVGIPMIVVGLEALLARAALPGGGLASPSLALAATIGAVLFYIALDRRFGAVMAILLGLALACGSRIAAEPRAIWLALAVGLFAVGWVVQFVGHVFEGKKPAFVDDLFGLLIGPLFVTAEAGFALGLRLELAEAIAESTVADGVTAD